MRTHHSSVVTRPARQTCKHQASGINPSQSLILALCTDAGSKGSRRWLLSAARQKPPGPERAESFELRPVDSVPDFEAIGSLDLEIAASLLQANDRLPMGFFFFSPPCGLAMVEKRNDRSLEPR
jgi:hypothetical protein